MGLPDRDDYAIVGGEITDYQPAEDASTDLPALADAIARCNVAAMSRVVTRAYAAFTTNGTTCTLLDCDGCWPSGTFGGPNAPTVTRTGLGLYTVTWPTTITDERGVTHNLNLRRGLGDIEPGSSPPAIFVHVSCPTPNTASVEAINTNTGTVWDPTSAIVVTVW